MGEKSCVIIEPLLFHLTFNIQMFTIKCDSQHHFLLKLCGHTIPEIQY